MNKEDGIYLDNKIFDQASIDKVILDKSISLWYYMTPTGLEGPYVSKDVIASMVKVT